MNRKVTLLLVLVIALAAQLAAQRSSENVEVTVEDLVATPVGVSITLRAPDSSDRIRMLIGVSEGRSIARAMRGRKSSRPMTHDLFKPRRDQGCRQAWGVFLARPETEEERKPQDQSKLLHYRPRLTHFMMCP